MNDKSKQIEDLTEQKLKHLKHDRVYHGTGGTPNNDFDYAKCRDEAIKQIEEEEIEEEYLKLKSEIKKAKGNEDKARRWVDLSIFCQNYKYCLPWVDGKEAIECMREALKLCPSNADYTDELAELLEPYQVEGKEDNNKIKGIGIGD